MRKPAGVAYLVTNTVNGKRYVGITVQKPHLRWSAHQRQARSKSKAKFLHKAITKYGAECFLFEVVASATTREDLSVLEQTLIVQYRTFFAEGSGYNLTAGGGGVAQFRHSKETCFRMSAARRGKTQSPEAIEKIRACHIGRVASDETKAKQRAAKLGRALSPEHSAKIAAALSGKPKSEEHKAKQRGQLRPKQSAALAGRPRTPETVEKVRAALKGRAPAPQTVAARRAAWPKGSKHTPESLAKIASASRAMHARRAAAKAGESP